MAVNVADSVLWAFNSDVMLHVRKNVFYGHMTFSFLQEMELQLYSINLGAPLYVKKMVTDDHG